MHPPDAAEIYALETVNGFYFLGEEQSRTIHARYPPNAQRADSGRVVRLVSLLALCGHASRIDFSTST